ncbi:hypothetical protein G6F68_019516 [Rhizopus microsporus]|nr:hypothetical protein G6F68_019516 [Rhizopus microsporus]
MNYRHARWRGSALFRDGPRQSRAPPPSPAQSHRSAVNVRRRCAGTLRRCCRAVRRAHRGRRLPRPRCNALRPA